jgi:hypothetical protein
MTDEEKAVADKARKDADDLAAKLDAALSKLDAAHARLDAMDKARKDADAEREEKAARERDEGEKERARADKARRDAARKDRFGARKDGEDDASYKARCDADEDAERKANEEDGDEEKVAADKARKARKDAEDRHESERADRARKDAEEKERMEREDKTRADSALRQENNDLKARLAAVEGMVAHLTRETPAEERNALAQAQARADGVAGLFGERAAAPMPGESSADYRRRLVAKFKQHSPKFAETDLSRLDAAVLGPIEDIIYNDAASAARNPTRAAHGVVIPITTRENGRDVTRFTGDPLGWMAPFMLDGMAFRMPERRAG